MIICHQYQYLFIEIPITASWAIHHELRQHYGGEPILHKHASYPEFLRVANSKERGYFVFATVRNPLDVAVSRYFKYKVDPKDVFSSRTSVNALRAEDSDVRKYKFIQDTHASFEDYFQRFHRRPFNGMIELSSNDLDFVIRYENLQAGFAQVLQYLDIEQIRPIPVSNKTPSKRSEWQSYYTPAIIQQAKNKFGPFMKKWGYPFPKEWGGTSIRWQDEWAFRLLSLAQRIYWLQFRYNDGFMGKTARWLRSFLIR